MAHAASGRRGLAGDEADHGLSYVLLDVLRGDFFRIAADFANQHDCVCVRIFVEHAHSVQEAGADDGIAADSDTCGLANAKLRKLIHGFVSQRAAAADKTDLTLLVDRARHDSDFAFSRRNNPGTVRADEARR